MALSGNKKILCFDGEIGANIDLSLVKELEQDGPFVVRSPEEEPSLRWSFPTCFVIATRR
jgi:hypothetical protein